MLRHFSNNMGSNEKIRMETGRLWVTLCSRSAAWLQKIWYPWILVMAVKRVKALTVGELFDSQSRQRVSSQRALVVVVGGGLARRSHVAVQHDAVQHGVHVAIGEHLLSTTTTTTSITTTMFSWSTCPQLNSQATGPSVCPTYCIRPTSFSVPSPFLLSLIHLIPCPVTKLPHPSPLKFSYELLSCV